MGEIQKGKSWGGDRKKEMMKQGDTMEGKEENVIEVRKNTGAKEVL